MSVEGSDKGIKVLADCTDANFPLTANGETYHLGVKKGEVANRIITSGDVRRIELIAENTPDFTIISQFQSPRLFKIITGKYKDVEISLVASLMGYPNMDFTIRELRAVIDGPMVIIRLGTCGTLLETIQVGDVCVAKAGYMVIRNPDGFNERIPESIRPQKYIITEPIPTNRELTNLLFEKIIKYIPENSVHIGLNGSADSFYSSQGRETILFRDDNKDLIEAVKQKYPDTCILEMESAHMMSLADCATIPIYCTASAIVIAQRLTNAFLDQKTKHERELNMGFAAMETVSEFKL